MHPSDGHAAHEWGPGQLTACEGDQDRGRSRPFVKVTHVLFPLATAQPRERQDRTEADGQLGSWPQALSPQHFALFLLIMARDCVSNVCLFFFLQDCETHKANVRACSMPA